jgi:hypothetical protein
MDNILASRYTGFVPESSVRAERSMAMSVRRNHQGPDDQQEESARPTRKKPTIRVIPGVETVAPAERRPPKIRVIGDDRLTPQERKERFASNLDRLISILGLTRKEAAEQIGIPYKLVRRLASAGVSCTEERNIESLTRIVRHFALPGVDHLWRDDLLRLLLTTPDGNDFVEKFRNRLLAERERRLAAAQVVVQEEVTLMGRALGVEDAIEPPLTGPNANKVAVILASPKADTFQHLIDDYYELVRQAAESRAVDRGDERRATPG